MPESVRWLLAKGRIEEAQAIIRKAAKVNGKHIPEEIIQKLSIPEEQVQKEPATNIFKSTTLILRFINCCICWITCTFLFYGLTLNSVALAGNSYIDFILTSLVEIPAYFVTCFVVDRAGRRLSQCVSFLLSGVACLAFIFIGEGFIRLLFGFH